MTTMVHFVLLNYEATCSPYLSVKKLKILANTEKRVEVMYYNADQ